LSVVLSRCSSDVWLSLQKVMSSHNSQTSLGTVVTPGLGVFVGSVRHSPGVSRVESAPTATPRRSSPSTHRGEPGREVFIGVPFATTRYLPTLVRVIAVAPGSKVH
jgi:hypothetical protein